MYNQHNIYFLDYFGSFCMFLIFCCDKVLTLLHMNTNNGINSPIRGRYIITFLSVATSSCSQTWRQLWRVLEISDVILLIADVRHPVGANDFASTDCICRTEIASHLLIISEYIYC